jgi:beta-glucosidase
MFKKRHTKLWVSVLSVSGAISLISAAAWIASPSYKQALDVAWNVKTSDTITVGDDDNANTEYYKSAYSSDEELENDEKELCSNLEKEGAVLLKNDNNTLPLAKSTKFSLFSTSSVDPVYGGTGSGQVNVNDATTIRKALNSHFETKCTNSTLFDHYKNDLSKYRRVNAATTGGKIDEYKINEAPWSEVITSEVENSFAQYGDVALVVLARSGGEGNDLPMTECSDGYNGDYLHLNQNEMDMLAGLKAYKDKGVFKKIVVLLNGSNMIQLDFMTKDTYGIDAALWIGDPGTTGMDGVASILSGDTCPSGRLSETFLNNTKSSPAAINFGLHAYTNSSNGTGEYSTSWVQYNVMGGTDECNENYMVYQEGIYIGYKYYETRYEDYVTGKGNAGNYQYSDDVAYPFGYGQSYTTFAYSDFSLKENGSNIDFTVTVTNTGEVEGKDSVEIYVQAPYDHTEKNAVEKASVQLAGFTKTKSLKKGESQTVNVSVKKKDFASYDSEIEKTFILDEGTYYFSVGDGAHDNMNNILAKKGYTVSNTSGRMDSDGNENNVITWDLSKKDTTTAAYSEETGYKITNQFDHADLNKYEGTKDSQSITYLTRKDWTGTMPTTYVKLSINDTMWKDGLSSKSEDRKNIIKKMEEKYYSDVKDVPATSQANGLSAVMFLNREDINEETEDAKDWDRLVQQASFSEMDNLIKNGFHKTQVVESLGLPETADENGPQGYTKSLTSGSSGMGYTSEDIMASTRNLDLVSNMGKDIGEDCRRAASGTDSKVKTSGIYGPACNIHRTPYCGRNFEYYSEDSLLTSKTVEPEVNAIQKTGVYVMTKHFALNDQESGRYGISTWANEQSIREIYLRAFEGSVLGGGAGVMTSFNRIGVTWAGADYALMTTVLRDEWGMKGMAITDCSVFAGYMDITMGLLAGQDIWDGSGSAGSLSGYENNAAVVTAMQRATKRIVYSISHSIAMNGIKQNTKFVAITSWWLVILMVCTFVFGIIALGSVAMLILEKKLVNKE